MNLRLLLPLVGAALLGLTGCPVEPEPPLVPPAPPTIVSFSATPETTTPGGTVTLAWKVEEAQTLRLERMSGGLSLEAVPLEGEHSVTVERDEVFVLSALSEGGQDVRALRVSTGAPQGLLMLAAAPAQVRAGEPVTLIYSGPASATGDASLRLENDAGESIPLPAAHTGTLTVTPRFDTTYTLRGAGEQTAAQVAVSPAILSATLTRDAADGRRVTVKWEAGGAESITVHASGRGELFTGDTRGVVASGQLEDVIPASLGEDATQVYTITVGDRPAQAVREVSLRVGGEVAIDSFIVPELAREGGEVVLTWKTRGASRVQVWKGDQQLREATSAAEMRDGVLGVPAPDEETEYVLRAISSRGEVVTKTGKTRPIGPTQFVTFEPDKTSIAQGGEPVVLTWEVTNARRMRIEAGALTGAAQNYNLRHVVHELVGPAAEKGSITVYPNEATMQYRLTADNTVGDSVQMVSRNVTVSALSGVKTWPESLPRPSSGPRPEAALAQDAFPGALAYEGFPHVAHNESGAEFVDIRGEGQLLEFLTNNLDHGNFTYLLPEPLTLFSFGTRFQAQTRAVVSSNGWFTVNTTGTANQGPRDNDQGLPSQDWLSSTTPIIAPFFDDLIQIPGLTEVHAHIGGLGEDRRLIVQWSDIVKKDSPESRLTFQAQLYPSGKLVFAYQKLEGLLTLDATVGAQAPGNLSALLAPQHPVAGDTFTFFGRTAEPQPFEIPFNGYFGRVIFPDGFMEVNAMPTILPHVTSNTYNAFAITEVNFAGGPGTTNGQWVEVTNLTQQPHNLRGWSLDFGPQRRHTITTDLVLPAGGQLLFAQTADADDGLPVDHVWGTSIGMSPHEGQVSLSSGGHAYSTVTWALGEHKGPGVSLRFEPKPLAPHLVWNTSATVLGLECFGDTPYGTKGQLGTPKLPDPGCFPYSHVATTGLFEPLAGDVDATALTITNPRGEAFTADLPFPVRVGHTVTSQLTLVSNGFLTLEPLECRIATTGCFTTNATSPSPTSDPRGTVAVFWDALRGSDTRPQIFWRAFDPDGIPRSGDEYVLVSWERMSIYHSTASHVADVNFQVRLTAHGTVEYQFGPMGTTSTLASYVNQTRGNSATTWLEEPGGRAALRVNVNSMTPGVAPGDRHVFTWNP